MQNTMISLVIPVHNAEAYLDLCLKSVFDQTFTDYEVIIVNDGSSDKSEEIILEYSKKYNNLKYIKQKNMGVSEARNNALASIHGKYTMFLDSDDYIEKDMLECLYNKAEQNSADVTICGYNIFYDNNINVKDKVAFKINESKKYDSKSVTNMVFKNELICFLWNKLFLTSNLFNHNLHFEKDRYSQDWFPVFKELYLAENICFINKPLYNYRIRKDSNSHNKSLKKVIDHTFAIKSIVKFIYSNNATEIDEKLLYKFIITHQFMNLRTCIESKRENNKEIYSISNIKKIHSLNIIFNSNITVNEKIKFILYKCKLLHLCYSIS